MDASTTSAIIEHLRAVADRTHTAPGVPKGFMNIRQMAQALNCSTRKVYGMLDQLGEDRVEVYMGRRLRRDGILTGCPYYRIREAYEE